jgi:hypothetical protein
MPLHEFGFQNHEYVRRQLRDGGYFWEAYAQLPIESGCTFAYLPENCSKERAAKLEEAVLGGFDDTTCFREEEEFVLQHLRRVKGNVAILGVNLSNRLISAKSSRFNVLPTGSSSKAYYDKVLVLHGQTVTKNEIRGAFTLAASPVVFAALLETHEDNPIQWIKDQLGESMLGALVARTVGLIVEAYRGEGLLFWSASPDAR